jgi:hypothetical protein
VKSDFVSTDSDFFSTAALGLGLVSMTIIFGTLPAPVLTVTTFLGGMIVYSCDSNNLDHGVSNFCGGGALSANKTSASRLLQSSLF